MGAQGFKIDMTQEILQPKIAIVYLSYHCEPYIPLVLPAIEKLTYPKHALEWVIVDNPHPEHGASVDFLNCEVMPKSDESLPKVTILANEKNLGFAGGNNVGVKYAIENNFDYVFFLNNDAYPAPDCFEKLIKVFETQKNIGIAQSMILLHKNKEKINSSGNAIHFKKLHEHKSYSIKDIDYASGSAMMVSCDLLKQIGGWDEDFFLYHEDMELCLRARVLAGKRIVLAPKSIVYHAYDFSRSIKKYFWMERNRFAVWLMYMKWRTLILLAPAMIFMEIGQIFFSILRGWPKEKFKVYAYWLNFRNWKRWLSKRRKIQTQRKIKDREIMRDFVGKILFQEQEVEHFLLKYVGNPFFNFYWKVVQKLIKW